VRGTPRYQSLLSHPGREWRLCIGGGGRTQGYVVGRGQHQWWTYQGGSRIEGDRCGSISLLELRGRRLPL